MEDHFVERREFYRIDYEKPVQFREFVSGHAHGALKAVSKNISQSGILFISKSFPKISSIVWINLQMKDLSICKEIESRAITIKHGILGKVVRVEENPGSAGYSVGACFLKKDARETQAIEKKIEKALSSNR